MNKSLFFCGLLLGIIATIPACKTTRATTRTQPAQFTPQPETWRMLLDSCQKKKFTFQTLSISGKATADIPNQSFSGLSVSYKINMMADSMIWVKVSMFGIEGMRALITPTKIQILDRQQQQARILPFSAIKDLAGIEADFGMIQNLLVGNLPVVNESIGRQKPENEPIWLQCKQDSVQFAYLIDKLTFKTTDMTALQNTPKQKAVIHFEAFTSIQNQLFPQVMNWEAENGKQTAKLFLNHNRIEHNPAEITFQFAIPENYEIVK